MPSAGPSSAREIRARLSASRLARYESSTGGDIDTALELYLWNARISAAFFESLHLLEVGLRNTMHDQLQAWVSSDSPSAGRLPWYRDPFVPLTQRSRDRIAEARARVLADGRAELPGRVVAELSFGFWWSLLAEHYNRRLWAPCLKAAFSTSRRGRLHGDLDGLIKLRNRVAHHEPVYDRDLLADWARLLDICTRISPVFADWVRQSSRVPSVLHARPR